VTQTADRVKETTTTTGTGNLTLAGAAAQFRSFNAAFGLNVMFSYVIVDADGVDWETGRGYLSGTTTLVRSVVTRSTNADALVSLSAGTHTVFSTVTENAFESLAGIRYAAARGHEML
jgi:hypothetical protein